VTLSLPDSFLVVIPARYASSRFPGKALADLGGQTVLRRCFDQVNKVVDRQHIIIATDDERIADECRAHDMPFAMTSTACLTGTDRVAEVATQHSAEWFINVQGDEPFLDPEGLVAMLSAAASTAASVGVINAYSAIREESDFRSATVPKVVIDQSGRLLYISRGSIPTSKAFAFVEAKRQIGLYAFRRDALTLFASRSQKTPLEEIEDIEILRFVELGVTVNMIEVDSVGIAIDTPEDLERARHYLATR
jgi:3-deoxy-manno-octulosonate cytidylyltransferase (CMP-KDO synthetase)